MSEKEKMLKGEMYYPNDEELINLRTRARDIFYEFNQTKASETDFTFETDIFSPFSHAPPFL